MRLLQRDNEGGLGLTEFIGNNIPPYAILSHTWSQTSKEVTFAAFMSGEYAHNPDYAASFEKIRQCGEQARRDGLEYFWIDTCCINKDSSAELSEAINSMYAWYRDADTCYAFLSDVHHKDEFNKSRWFMRGWTLQELLAPADIIFFDASWSVVGFKTSLIHPISQHTGIDVRALHGGASQDIFSIAERMSWAAHRQTTRLEDEAYCLMGIFDVNMPLIYGEGNRAFLRLQEELLKKFNAGSIFAYIASNAVSQSTLAKTEPMGKLTSTSTSRPEILKESCEMRPCDTTGLFATSPALFQHSGDVVSRPSSVNPEGPSMVPRVRMSGRTIKFHGFLWQPKSLSIPSSCTADTDRQQLQEVIKKECNIKFSLSSVLEIARCNRIYYGSWAIAFLGCHHRRERGIIGIMLKRSTVRGTYSRIHYPSLVQTDSSWSDIAFVPNSSITEIDIEADMLSSKAQSPSAHAEPRLLEAVTFRSTNLSDYGFTRQHHPPPLDELVEYSATEIPDIPRIVFKPNIDFSTEGTLICAFFTNTFSQPEKFPDVIAAEQYVTVPTRKGFSTTVALNNSLQFSLRTQMQWRRGGDHRRKRCLLTLSIEEEKDDAEGDVMREVETMERS